MEYVAMFFVLVTAVYFAVSGFKAWRASRFYLKFGRGTGADDSYLIEPPPMMGCATLRIDKISFAGTKSWEKAKKCTKFFFFGENQDDFFALDSNFTIQIKNASPGGPILAGTFLPSWNLKGTNRDRAVFPEALKLDSGAVYRMVLCRDEQNKAAVFFKIDGGDVYKATKGGEYA